MQTFTTCLQIMNLMVLLVFSVVQKVNASAKAGEASIYEGSTVDLSLQNQ